MIYRKPSNTESTTRTKQYAFSELKVKCTKSRRTLESKWVQYGKCARKVLQGHASVGDASIRSPP